MSQFHSFLDSMIIKDIKYRTFIIVLFIFRKWHFLIKIKFLVSTFCRKNHVRLAFFFYLSLNWSFTRKLLVPKGNQTFYENIVLETREEGENDYLFQFKEAWKSYKCNWWRWNETHPYEEKANTFYWDF